MWKVEKIISKGDYLYAVVKEHPHAIKFGYVLHHRIVMENHLGRLLNPDEVVHHINHDKKDNRIENLELKDSKDHVRGHNIERGRTLVQFICPQCGKSFVKEKRKSHIDKGGRASFCSRSCNGKFGRKEQLFGLTAEMKVAISVNIVRLFNSHDNAEQTGMTGCVETIRHSPENGEDIVQPTNRKVPQ